MGKLPTQINVIVHYPKTEEGRQELARRVALVHADAVNQHIKNLNCPTSDKLKLLDAVIETAKKTYGKAVEQANREEGQMTIS